MSPDWTPILLLLLLILAANALPALLGLVLGPARPIDGSRLGGDRQPPLGATKTWRGLMVALTATPILAAAAGLHWWLGLAVAAGAMAGDLVASFVKRRLGLVSSTSVPMLDQVPESLIPAILVRDQLALTWPDVAILVASFTVLDLLLTPVGKGLARTWHRISGP